MKLFGILILIVSLRNSAAAQDSRRWESLSQLKTGDKVRLSLLAGNPQVGEFQNWTPEQITVGTASTQKTEVRRVELYRRGESHRAKHAAIGAAIGFGGGFALGAAAGGCGQRDFICFPRGVAGAVVGVSGALLGAGIGALIPPRSTTVIYAVK